MSTPCGFGAAVLKCCVLGLILVGVGCQGGGGGNGGDPTEVAVGGSAVKGPLSGGEVRVFQFAADGSKGEEISGPFMTDADGAWSGPIPLGNGRFMLVAISAGTYTDEDTGSDVTLTEDQELLGVLDFFTNALVTATPVTQVLLEAARVEASAEGESIDGAILATVARFETVLGVDFTRTEPSFDADGSVEAQTYGALLGGLSRMIARDAAYGPVAGAHAFDVVSAVALDLADGRLDGLDAAGAAIEVSVGMGTVALGASDPTGIDAWAAAATAFADETPGLEDIDIPAGLDLTNS